MKNEESVTQSFTALGACGIMRTLAQIACIAAAWSCSGLLGVTCGQDLRSFGQWNERAEETYTSAGKAEFRECAARLLSPHSVPTLRAILASDSYPVLRLAAFYSAVEKQPESTCDFLMCLVIDTKDILLYEDELALISTGQCNVTLQDLSSHSPSGSKDSRLVNFIMIARALPEAKLVEILSSDKRGAINSTGLGILLEEVCRKKPDWRKSAAYPVIKEKLNELKLAPGYAQIAVVKFYPFSSDDEALAHVLFLLDNEEIPDPPAILAVLSKRALVLAKVDKLISDATNKEVVRRRLDELRKR